MKKTPKTDRQINYIKKIKYIHENPVRSGIVTYPEEYLYSSAKNYADEVNLLDITKIDLLWKTVNKYYDSGEKSLSRTGMQESYQIWNNYYGLRKFEAW